MERIPIGGAWVATLGCEGNQWEGYHKSSNQMATQVGTIPRENGNLVGEKLGNRIITERTTKT